MLVVEVFEGLVVVHGTLFQFPVVLYHVDVLQTIVVGVYVVLVGALTDVEHTFILTVDINDGGAPGLPVEVYVLGHGALDDGVAHVEVVEVVACITQHETLEVLQARLLVGEELVVETLLAKALVGIDGQRLSD